MEMDDDEKNSTDLVKNQPSGHNQHLSLHGPGFLPEAQIASSTNAMAVMGNPFPPGLWNPSAQNLSLGETNANAMITGHPFSSLLGMLSAGVPPFEATSGFIDCGTGFPCFNGSNLGALINHPFPSTQPLSNFQNGIEPSREIEPTVGEGCKDASLTGGVPQGDAERSHGVDASNKELSKPECSGGAGQDEGPSVSCAKKRKRSGQDGRVKHVEGSQQLATAAARQKNDNDEKGETNRPVMSSGKSNGKQTKDNAGALKEEYIHVRARRGQATNSHSLAERVRREKISERMKFLQDLVPGCSKVTGKAVMLDEIINYVQSLQRQVEFLSMKLAAVNPTLDFNMERILSKDFFQSQDTTASSAYGFSLDIGHPHLHLPKHSQAGLPSVVSPTDAFGRVINAPVGTSSTFKDPTHQMPKNFDGEFHNVIGMPFTPLNNQESNGKP